MMHPADTQIYVLQEAILRIWSQLLWTNILVNII